MPSLPQVPEGTGSSRFTGLRGCGPAAEAVCACVAGEAAAGGQLELPAVHGAGQRGAVGLAEPGEVRLQVRAAALDD